MQEMLSFTPLQTPFLELYVSLTLVNYFLIKIPSKAPESCGAIEASHSIGCMSALK